MKITKNTILIFLGGLTLPSVFLSAYVDTVRFKFFPFRQYLGINLWEAGILWMGITLWMVIEAILKYLNENSQQTKPLSIPPSKRSVFISSVVKDGGSKDKTADTHIKQEEKKDG